MHTEATELLTQGGAVTGVRDRSADGSSGELVSSTRLLGPALKGDITLVGAGSGAPRCRSGCCSASRCCRPYRQPQWGSDCSRSTPPPSPVVTLVTKQTAGFLVD